MHQMTYELPWELNSPAYYVYIMYLAPPQKKKKKSKKERKKIGPSAPNDLKMTLNY